MDHTKQSDNVVAWTVPAQTETNLVIMNSVSGFKTTSSGLGLKCTPIKNFNRLGSNT